MRTLAGVALVISMSAMSLIADILIRPKSVSLAEEWDLFCAVGVIVGMIMVIIDSISEWTKENRS